MQSAINASLWENSVPVLQELSLKNQGDDELSLVEISVSSEPPFLLPRSWRPQQVAAGQLHLVKDLDIRLDGARLAAQTEASRATVTCVASASGRELVRESRDVRVLARNEWGGLSGIPDILAAFVMPNDPAVQRILRAASDILRQAGQSPDLMAIKRTRTAFEHRRRPCGTLSARSTSPTSTRQGLSSRAASASGCRAKCSKTAGDLS